MLIPKWLAKYFCMPSLSAKEAGIDGTWLDGRLLQPHDRVWPVPAGLPMGFAWSVFFAQRSGESKAHSTPLLEGAMRLSDSRAPFVITISVELWCLLWYYVYVDNLGVLGASKWLVSDAMDQLCESFEKDALVIHERDMT